MTVMRLNASHPLQPNNREEKEAKLKDFITRDLDLRRGRAVEGPAIRYALVARAPDSPSARALQALGAEIMAAGIEIKVILFESDCGFEDGAQSETLLDLAGIDIRFFRDPRFIAAHEQLILGANSSWIGDCMRRDPAKRDAFEVFQGSNKTIAQHAAVSFNRLWARAKPAKAGIVDGLAPDFVLAGQTNPADIPRPGNRR